MSTVSLHDLILNAHHVWLDHHEIDVISTEPDHAGGPPTLRVECAEDHVWLIPDQQVTLNHLGECSGKDHGGLDCIFQFSMARPMTHADLEDV